MTEPYFPRPYRRWYQFGFRSLSVLYTRTRKRPIFRARMMWQRAHRGFSDEDCWGLNNHLARVTVGGIKNLREWANGYPAELGSNEAWDAILAQIQEGFEVWLEHDGWFGTNDQEAEKKFKEAIALYGHWFGALWD